MSILGWVRNWSNITRLSLTYSLVVLLGMARKVFSYLNSQQKSETERIPSKHVFLYYYPINISSSPWRRRVELRSEKDMPICNSISNVCGERKHSYRFPVISTGCTSLAQVHRIKYFLVSHSTLFFTCFVRKQFLPRFSEINVTVVGINVGSDAEDFGSHF